MKKTALVALPVLALALALACALRHPAEAGSQSLKPLVVAAPASRVVAEGRVAAYPGGEVVVGPTTPARSRASSSARRTAS